MRKAAIDVGSNSVLLLVAERSDAGWRPVYEDTAVTALGEGTKTTGLLGDAGVQRTLDALRRFYQKAQELGATEVVAGATMAARIAQNTNNFIASAQAQGTPFIVLSGETEAEWGFRSVVEDPLFSEVERLSVIDPGGHSTEIVVAHRASAGWNVSFRKSYPIGTLGLRNTHFPNERLSSGEIFAGMAFIDGQIDIHPDLAAGSTAVVLGASGTNLISIRDRLLTWDPGKVHGKRLSFEEISKAFGTLATMSDNERAQVPGMEAGREKTIHLGALILERSLHALRLEEVVVSVRGWRYAALDVQPGDLKGL